jgi:hypothetical protein
MQQETLVERFVGKRLSTNTLRHWTTKTFFLVLGYAPKSLVLAKCWMAWTFRSTMDTQKILTGNWSFGAQSLFLKKRFVDFDATSKRVDISPVWVRIPGLPLIFWSEEVFREIRNTIGFFYGADRSYISSGYMGMTRILVGIKLSEGISEDITITFIGTSIKQSLYYEGIPFKCGRSRDCANA